MIFSDPFLVLVLIDSLSIKGPLKDLSEPDVFLVASFDELQ